MLVTPQVHGPTFIPGVMQTLLVACSVPPLALVVLFVVVNTGVQRTSYRNSKAFFKKLFYRLSMSVSASPTLKMKLLFLAVVMCPVLQLNDSEVNKFSISESSLSLSAGIP